MRAGSKTNKSTVINRKYKSISLFGNDVKSIQSIHSYLLQLVQRGAIFLLFIEILWVLVLASPDGVTVVCNGLWVGGVLARIAGSDRETLDSSVGVDLRHVDAGAAQGRVEISSLQRCKGDRGWEEHGVLVIEAMLNGAAHVGLVIVVESGVGAVAANAVPERRH